MFRKTITLTLIAWLSGFGNSQAISSTTTESASVNINVAYIDKTPLSTLWDLPRVHGDPLQPAVTHVVQVGMQDQLLFNPAQVQAKPGDIVAFNFHRLNHSVTESSLLSPCEKVSGGFDSGFGQSGSSDIPEQPDPSLNVVAFSVNDWAPRWFFCAQTRPQEHCSAGMVFGLNPADRMNQFLDNAREGISISQRFNNSTGYLTTSWPYESMATTKSSDSVPNETSTSSSLSLPTPLAIVSDFVNGLSSVIASPTLFNLVSLTSTVSNDQGSSALISSGSTTSPTTMARSELTTGASATSSSMVVPQLTNTTPVNVNTSSNTTAFPIINATTLSIIARTSGESLQVKPFTGQGRRRWDTSALVLMVGSSVIINILLHIILH